MKQPPPTTPLAATEPLETLLDLLGPVIDITGFAGGDYHCDRCSARAARHGPPMPIRHPLLSFRTVDYDRWTGRQKSGVLFYVLALRQVDVSMPLMVGHTTARSLRHHWTRLPASERGRFASGALLHHQPATLALIEARLADAAGAPLRLYGGPLGELLPAIQAGLLAVPRTRRLRYPAGAAEEALVATSLAAEITALIAERGDPRGPETTRACESATPVRAVAR